MSGHRLDFFFDYSSPFAYLGATQVGRVAQGADCVWHPILLGGLFKSIGSPNVPFHTFPRAKQKYQIDDMKRWAEHYGEPFAFPTRFPMNTVTALRMTLQLEGDERSKLALPIFRAYWSEDRDISDKQELATIADDAGFDGQALLAGASEQPIKDALRDETGLAEKLGICGAPSFIVTPTGAPLEEGVLFWGQDRLLFVEKALEGWRPKNG